MENSLNDILLSICKEYELPEDSIQPIKAKLSKEFYFKLKDFNNLNKEKWKEYMLPDNLYNLLLEKFTQENKKNELKSLNEISFEIISTINNNQIQKVELLQLTKGDIENGLNEIDKEIKNINNKREALGLIEGIINNILTHPKEDKYRKINKNKITQKYPYDSLFKFLTLMKFRKSTEDDSYIKYSKDALWLNNIIPLMYEHYNLPYDFLKPTNNNIKQSMKRSSMTNKMINQSGVNVEYQPMKTEPCQNSNEMKNTIYDNKDTKKEESKQIVKDEKIEKEELEKLNKEKEKEEKKRTLEDIYNKEKMLSKTIEDLINDENKRREIILEKAACIKMPKCYFMVKPLLYDIIVKEYSVKHKYIPKEEDITLFQNQKQIITQRQANNSKENIDKFYKLINTPIFVAKDCFFIFPDYYIIQGTFCFNESIKDLYNFVRRFLHSSKENFYLVYKQEKVTENDLKLSKLIVDHQTCFEVVFPVIYCKLKEDELDKLKVSLI